LGTKGDKNSKGISTFITTLMLMMLAIVVGIAIYTYTMGYVEVQPVNGTPATNQKGVLMIGESIKIDDSHYLIYSGDFSTEAVFTIVYYPNSSSVVGTCTYQLIINRIPSTMKINGSTIIVADYNSSTATIEIKK